MPTLAKNLRHRLQRPREFRLGRGGFTFVEILFAVMILGIGFIMIAAIFPATIQQTSATLADTQGASIAQGAIQYLQSIATDVTLPATAGIVAPLNDEAWKQCRGNFVCSQNRRYAWTALYRRDNTMTGPADYAQVFVIVAQCRNKPEFTSVGLPNDVDRPGNNFAANIEPRVVKVSVNWNGSKQCGEAVFATDGPQAPSAFVILANQVPGRIYQLGRPLDIGGNRFFELAPGGDMLLNSAGFLTDVNVNNVDAYVLGRGYEDVINGNLNYAGGPMDIAVYTSFVRINR